MTSARWISTERREISIENIEDCDRACGAVYSLCGGTGQHIEFAQDADGTWAMTVMDGTGRHTLFSGCKTVEELIGRLMDRVESRKRINAPAHAGETTPD
jgi:hypothetical protein